MRIDSHSSRPWPTQRAAAANRPQFTSMTRREMREWMNTEIKRGAMDLDESTPFVFMTLDLPVSKDPVVAEAARERWLDEHVNFVDTAQRGLEAARSRHDAESAHIMESAIVIMRRYSLMAPPP